ncbi:MAG TPA: toxin [Campylobacterales bacterium]|nr:toxin [Campylobacterales bacterium]
MRLSWNEEKNQKLKAQRGVSFEMVAQMMIDEEYIGVIAHPNAEKYPNQQIFLFEIDGYCYAVPAVINGDEIFLKTIYPSRKITKQHKKDEK